MSAALKSIFSSSSTTRARGGHTSLPRHRRRTTFLRLAPGPVVGSDHGVSLPLFSWKADRPCLSIQNDKSTSCPATLIVLSPFCKARRRCRCKKPSPEPRDEDDGPLLPPAATLA
ncbi:hypothetical protein GDO81_022876 [Engystomops pustulosus]|uniref:Uncharacterized protein n=1 Tax=Engystomops pustulosus TaxID=76066 RepID=A0AAV6YT67_ENGPU|nr:hypothetical protein GDO81_022876 [Engystomops pustulosus]